jgi:hypothetical protein
MRPCVVVRFMVIGDSSCRVVNLLMEVQQFQQQFRST